MTFAPMQKSQEAYIIGIAAGSSEDQDIELINNKLEEVTGIQGIEVSFQNINQPGITNDFWAIANQKAEASMSPKFSREYLRCKYRWAPNAVAIYVPNASMVAGARKKMIQMFGKDTGGDDPTWPDGTKMRFLPLKNGVIKSERTKAIIKKRMAYHIWMKAHDKVMLTNVTSIHEGADIFEGKSFSEYVMNMKDQHEQQIFRHFKRGWSRDPTKEKWLLAVQPHMVATANKILRNLQATLTEKYGNEVNKFFESKQSINSSSQSEQAEEDDDDSWFRDDDLDKKIKSGILQNDFIQFLQGNVDDDDKSSALSWGTGETNYTELETITKDSVSNVVSSITPGSNSITNEEIQERKELVRTTLCNMGIQEEELVKIINRHTPYELVMSGIGLTTWSIQGELLMIKGLREQLNKKDEDDV